MKCFRRLILLGALVGEVLAVSAGTAQETAKPSTTSEQPASTAPRGGSATAGVFAAVKDSELRPITAGGFVKDGPVIFKDIAEQAGVTQLDASHEGNRWTSSLFWRRTGSGVGLMDYDNDGWLDIYFVNSSTFKAMDGKEEAPHAALFHNNHDGTFTDVAAKAGVTNDRWGFGVAVADYDNDGWPDIFVANYGKNRLYHNNHDGTFTDVAEKAGVTLGNWSSGATWGDYDGDGRLDLFVAGYVHFDREHPPVGGTDGVSFAFCSFRGEAVNCGPHGLKGEPDHLFHNNGDGTFTDVSEKAGVADKPGYYGLSAIFVDVNNDGKVDLIVGNDSTPNYLYLNKGDGTFEDASYYSGFALNQQGRDQAGMGLAVGDYLNNGWVDLYTGTFSDDYKPLFRNGGDQGFTEISPEMGIAEVTYPFLTWATEFIDYDNDGWKDIFLVNGHVYPQVDKYDWGTSYAQRPLLFHNIDKGKKFEVMPAVIGTGLAEVIPGRGAAFGDLFNDGKIDVVINSMDHVPSLMRNVNPDSHHWVGLKLIGGPKSPRDAVGAAVYLTAGGIRQRADVLSGGSYESSNDQRPHFGIGDATRVDALEVHWPSGLVEQIALPSVDHFFTIQEGKGVVPGVLDEPGRPKPTEISRQKVAR
jgi:hypothetical protein